MEETRGKQDLKFFVFVTKIAVRMGLWYPKSFKQPLQYKSFLTLHLLLLSVYMFLELMYILKFYDSNYLEVIKTVATLAFHLVCFARVVIFYMHVRLMQEVYVILNRKSMDFEEFCIPDKSSKMKDKYDSLIEDARYKSYVLFYAFAVLSQTSIVSAYTNALANPAVKFDDARNKTVKHVIMPYSHYNLLDTSKSIYFYTELFLQSYANVFSTFSFVGKYLRFVRKNVLNNKNWVSN